MMNTRFWILAALTTVLGLSGCDKGAPAPKADHGEHDHGAHDHGAHAHHGGDTAANADAAKKDDAPAGPSIETGTFLLAVSPAQPAYTAGKPGALEIQLQSRGEWHVNEEYPIRVDLSAPEAVTLPKAELVKDDAKEFGEDEVRFLAAVEPSAAGTHEVSCDVSFALCTEENCILERRTVAMQMQVQ